jgi:flagellar assembly factor FliW
METNKMTRIESRLGPRDVDPDKVLHFPCGIIGFERERSFTLLRIQEDAPLHVLQSMNTPALGLLVADPFVFLPDFSLCIGDTEQRLLQAESPEDIAVLVTAAIPLGKPEQATLNLTGPIVINHRLRLGLQVPQNSRPRPVRIR